MRYILPVVSLTFFFAGGVAETTAGNCHATGTCSAEDGHTMLQVNSRRPDSSRSHTSVQEQNQDLPASRREGDISDVILALAQDEASVEMHGLSEAHDTDGEDGLGGKKGGGKGKGKGKGQGKDPSLLEDDMENGGPKGRGKGKGKGKGKRRGGEPSLLADVGDSEVGHEEEMGDEDDAQKVEDDIHKDDEGEHEMEEDEDSQESP